MRRVRVFRYLPGFNRKNFRQLIFSANFLKKAESEDTCSDSHCLGRKNL